MEQNLRVNQKKDRLLTFCIKKQSSIRIILVSDKKRERLSHANLDNEEKVNLQVQSKKDRKRILH